MRNFCLVVLLVWLALFPLVAVLADDVSQPNSSGDGQPITVWEKGKNGNDPIQAMKQLVGLPNGVVGESKQSLKERLVSSHARIVSEDDGSIVVRGKMKDGGELQVDFPYYFEHGEFVDRPVEIHGSKINK